jgi:hypothetical protein
MPVPVWGSAMIRRAACNSVLALATLALASAVAADAMAVCLNAGGSCLLQMQAPSDSETAKRQSTAQSKGAAKKKRPKGAADAPASTSETKAKDRPLIAPRTQPLH